MPARSQGAELIVESGDRRVRIEDVVVGEVWLASGQSNMEWSLEWIAGSQDVRRDEPDQAKLVERIEADMNTADPLLRFAKVKVVAAPDGPADDVKLMGSIARKPPPIDAWMPAEGENTRRVSATAFYFGRRLRDALGVPVGIVDATMGGTRIEPWLSRDVIDRDEALRAYRARFEAEQAAYDADRAAGRPAPPGLAPNQRWQYPSTRFNGMIAPIIGFPIRGVLWYQGESNTGRQPPTPDRYGQSLAWLIEDWRQRWGDDALPFYAAQIAGFDNQPRYDGKSWVRDQTRRATTTPHAGMAVTIDIGTADNVHPLNKIEVGERLARWALHHDYGVDVDAFSGPFVGNATIQDGRLVVAFDHTDGGLAVGEKTPLEPPRFDDRPVPMLEVLTERADWVAVQARIEGDTIVIPLEGLSGRPIAVRYAWVNTPVDRWFLYNNAGLPASPFRVNVD